MFRWKLQNSKKYNQTTICHSCGKIKNVCQSCVSDLNFGLPLYAREEYIKSKKDQGDEKALQLMNIPDSVDNRDHFMENKLNGDDKSFIKKIDENQKKRKEILEEILTKNGNVKGKESVNRHKNTLDYGSKTTIKSISKN